MGGIKCKGMNLIFCAYGCFQLRQLEMQLEQEYEEKQMVVHEKHDLEGLIATLCEQVMQDRGTD